MFLKTATFGVDEASGLEAAGGILKWLMSEKKTNALQSNCSSSAFFNVAQQSNTRLRTMRKRKI